MFLIHFFSPRYECILRQHETRFCLGTQRSSAIDLPKPSNLFGLDDRIVIIAYPRNARDTKPSRTLHAHLRGGLSRVALVREKKKKPSPSPSPCAEPSRSDASIISQYSPGASTPLKRLTPDFFTRLRAHTAPALGYKGPSGVSWDLCMYFARFGVVRRKRVHT